MSKVVKKIGRSIGSVVKGAVKVVKQVAKSKIGKVLIAAAAVYFGGAAIMGAMGGASAGTGFLGTMSGALQGAGAGISSAWSGLTGAFTGGGLSSLGQGFTGSYGAGSSAVAASNTAASMAASGGGFTGGGYGSVGTIGQTGAPVAGMTSAPAATSSAAGATGYAPAAATSNPGIISRAWDGLGQYGKMAAVQGSMQIAGGALQGKAAQDQMEDQRNYEQQQAQAARDRYNQNAGTSLWGNAPNASNYQYGGPSVFDQQTAQMNPNRYMPQPQMYYGGPSGLIGGNMAYPNPGYGYYPTYG